MILLLSKHQITNHRVIIYPFHILETWGTERVSCNCIWRANRVGSCCLQLFWNIIYHHGDARQYIKHTKPNTKTLSEDLSQGMSDKPEDCHWVTAVIITGVREVGKAWGFILFFFFNLIWPRTWPLILKRKWASLRQISLEQSSHPTITDFKWWFTEGHEE